MTGKTTSRFSEAARQNGRIVAVSPGDGLFHASAWLVVKNTAIYQSPPSLILIDKQAIYRSWTGTGGIGPTHDDITAEYVVEAFGVELFENPEIIAMMAARWGGEPNPARRRMTRAPVGGSLVKNPVRGPPGLQIGNVFVLAGVPAVMRGRDEGEVVARSITRVEA
jgi:hypothetical protein